MAGKPRNRLELRRQYDAAEPIDPMEDEADDLTDDTDDEEVERKPRKKKAPAKKPKATKAPKAAARMRIIWTVVNDAFKTVATFEFGQKAEAEARAAELTAKGKGTHFVQRVKEPMPDDAPGLGATLVQATEEEKAPAKATKSKPSKAAAPVVEEDEDIEDDEEDIVEDDEDDSEDDSDSDDD